MEEQVLQSADVQQDPEMELEEVALYQDNNGDNSGVLDDVVPCEPVTFEPQIGVGYDVVDSFNDGFYDDTGYTPTVDINKMVDIAPHDTVVSSGYELEEEVIPEEHNTPEDEQLDDIIGV